MIKSIRFSVLSLLCAGFLSFALVSCDANDDGNSDETPNIAFLSALQNTQWKHTSNNKIAFSTATATTTPVSGSEQTFSVKSSQTIDQLNQTTYWFGETQGTKDYVVYNSGEITSVNLGGIEQGRGWSIDDGSVFDPTKYIDPDLLGQWQNATGDKIEFKMVTPIVSTYPGYKYDFRNGTGSNSNYVQGVFDYCYTNNGAIYHTNSKTLMFHYTISNNTLLFQNTGYGFTPPLTPFSRSSFSWPDL